MRGMVLWLFLSLGRAKSETDCFPLPKELWEVRGQAGACPLLGANASISYLSTRHRKKWQLNFCGHITECLFEFASSDGEPVRLRVKGGADSEFAFELRLNGSLLAAKTCAAAPEPGGLCFVALSGRGWFGLLHKRAEGGDEVLFVQKLEIARNSQFEYLSIGRSNVTKFCIGDYLGGIHQNITPKGGWAPTVRDFL
jgi:hypothetical protein